MMIDDDDLDLSKERFFSLFAFFFFPFFVPFFPFFFFSPETLQPYIPFSILTTLS